MSKIDTSTCTIPCVEVESTVLQQIRCHARSSMQAEICGVLIGGVNNGTTRINACIAGEGAAQGGAHVTYTQETWAHIYKIKDAQYPDMTIVGWYHSHPGFGVFLSDHDLFIHQNFFSAPHQIAWVFDPHSDEEGCFGWIENKVEPLSRLTVLRQQRTTGQAVPRTQSTATSQSDEVEKASKRIFLRSRWFLACVKTFLFSVILGCIFSAGVVTGVKFPTWFKAVISALTNDNPEKTKADQGRTTNLPTKPTLESVKPTPPGQSGLLK
jgi:proteasome lid subunit RPN8/RPN11